MVRAKMGYRRKKKVAKHIQTYVHKVVDQAPEKKQTYFYVGSNVISNAGGQAVVLNMPRAGLLDQGVGDRQRIGAKIKVHGCSFSLSLQTTGNPAVGSRLQVRILLIYDKQPNGVILPFGEIFLAGATANQALLSSYQEKYKDQYNVLYDKVHTLAIGATDVNGDPYLPSKPIRVERKFSRPLKTSYYTNDNTTAISAIEQGAITLYLVAASSDMQGIDVQGSVLFTDE